MAGVFVLWALAGFASCTPTLKSGQWGTFRFIGSVLGKPPLNVLPPISDRNGDIFTLNGAIGLPMTNAFVSRATGGSLESCSITKGDAYGAHGWVGFTPSQALYWSGDALVTVPATGACFQILNVDPSTNVNLRFRAVFPWINDTPTRVTLVALIQGDTDPVPFSALVDITNGAFTTNVTEFEPSDAQSVTILGVGADPDTGNGFVLLTYVENGSTVMAGLFYDIGANLTATAQISGEPPPEYGILGYLQIASSGTIVGLTSTGSLAVFDQGGGAIVALDTSIVPVGLHKWDGQLWLVGTSSGMPVIIPVDGNGQPGMPIEWTASEEAAEGLGTLTVTDDRSFPAQTTTWPSVTTAIGSYPFLSAQSPWPHAPGVTLWAVAGPSDTLKTDLAIAPVGISYP
jgi:hypothetical protein